MNTFFITTPIYYVNDFPHLGHAYTTVIADTLARFYRRMGVPTLFVTGTDEHGQKIEKAAQDQGLNPKELADRVVERFRHLWELLGITYDDFIRTTEPRHSRVVLHLWKRMKERGDIYLGTYSGFYCVSCEAYYSEKELKEGTCPVCGKALRKREEPSYFFRLSRYGEVLLRHYEKHPNSVYPPERLKEVVAFLHRGLEDLSISRSHLRWGIPVPDDPNHVIYVWLDALANYLTVLDPLSPDSKLMHFWPPSVHLIGKDILRFHAIYWPAFLLSAGYELPQRIVAHGWWLIEGRKMSKSLKNVVDPWDLCARYNRDTLRYFLLREVPLGEDGDFRYSNLVHRLNGDLANDLGNLISRIHGILIRFGKGKVPLSPPETAFLERFAHLVERVKEKVQSFRLHQALTEIWGYVGELNEFVDRTEPWRLHRQGSFDDLSRVLANLAYGASSLGIILDPFLPDTALTIRRVYGVLLPETWNIPELESSGWVIPSSGELKPLAPLFPRLREEETRTRLTEVEYLLKEETAPGDPQPSSPVGVPEITLEEFSRVELKVGLISSATRIEGSDKLLELVVDLGEPSPRIIIAGIARRYSPEDLVGKRVVVVANLKPKKVMNKVSQGMILAGECEGRLELIEPPPTLSPGTRLK